MNKKTSDTALIIALLFFILSHINQREPAQSIAAVVGAMWVIVFLVRASGE